LNIVIIINFNFYFESITIMGGSCPQGTTEDAGLCYKPCPTGYKGVGPVCWGICPANTTDIGITCQKKTYSRGVGKIPTGCNNGEVNDGALCYKQCPANFKGVGPVCWGICPSGFTDIGVGCQKPAPYGRGAGHFSKSACENSSDHGASNGCEKWGLLWYPICDSGYHNVACCICSPNCPSGFTDTGEDCTKPTQTRGAGTVPTACNTGQTNDAGLCYTDCNSGYDGVATVCYAQCNDVTKDTGLDCLKDTQTRGVGTIPGPDWKFWLVLAIIIIVVIVVLIITGIIIKKIYF